MVQMDCFFIGRLSGAKGAVWQYTAIDVGSASCWAELHLSPRNPIGPVDLRARPAGGRRSRRPGLVGGQGDVRQRERVPLRRVRGGGRTGGSPSAVHPGRQAADQRRRGAGVQETILDECWKPAFARYLIPKYTGLRLDLDRYLTYYNTDRAHTGRWTKGRTQSRSSAR
jgi:hypothetical protein